MTGITRTSPLDMVDLRRTQRRVAALLNSQTVCPYCFGGKKKIPPGFCYVCSQLDPRGRGSRVNPYRHLFAGGLRACPHLPPAPHPTFVASDDDYDDDGFDEDDFEVGSDDGAMFDTKIVREDSEVDPRLFALPPVFVKDDPSQHNKGGKRRSKNGRLVPMVSENTFVTTNKRGQGQGHSQGQGQDPHGSDSRLPHLSNHTSLIAAEQGQGQGEGQGRGRRRRERDPRRLHSERIDRRMAGEVGAEHLQARSDSAIGMDSRGMLREKTDPPPQPIVVSILDQNGDRVRKIPLDQLPPGQKMPSQAFTAKDIEDNGVGGGDTMDKATRKRRKREKKERRRKEDGGSYSPSFSDRISISRETTLDSTAPDSPDFIFLSRLRSASWCECTHDRTEGGMKCSECSSAGGTHEKWCVSRNTVCERCGKAFKKKYTPLEGSRKPSFGAATSSGLIITSGVTSLSSMQSASKRHESCSPTKSGGKGGLEDKDSSRVRFQQDDGKVIFPQWDTVADSGVEDDFSSRDNNADYDQHSRQSHTQRQGKQSSKSYLPARPSGDLDRDVHRVAYDLALSDARFKVMFGTKKKKRGDNKKQPVKGIYFSYFPLLKNQKHGLTTQHNNAESSGGDDDMSSVPNKPFGFRTDSREGKRLKVKKGLKHILGDIKIDDYYPGGKKYPKHLTDKQNKGVTKMA